MIHYFVFLIMLALCSVFAGWASFRVNSAFSKYSGRQNASHMTGYDTAVRLLRMNGINDITVERTEGKLTDHYDPRHKTVRLSAATYGSDSVAAVAVAAHEIGHVVQGRKGYLPYKIRTAIVPVVNIGSRLALPVVLVGVLLELLFQYSSAGIYAAYTGVALYGLSTLFHLVTLPVEFDASRRAKKMLAAEGIVTKEEGKGADAVLSAAALTYVAGLLTSIVYFLRFAYIIFSLFGRRRND